MLSEPRIDENTRNIGLGFVQGTKSITLPFQINSSGELLIEVIPIGDPLSPLNASRIHLDENTHQIAAAVTNDSNETIIPLTVDIIVGLPCVRVELI